MFLHKAVPYALKFAFISSFAVTTAQAFPVDPIKVPVSDVNLSGIKSPYTLAYDSTDKKVVYYSPKTGRIATYNGLPQIGFARIPNGRAYLNAQITFDIQSSEREALLGAIRKAGYTPVIMPYVKTTVKPLLQGFDPDTGRVVCAEVADLESGGLKKICNASIYDSMSYVKSGPTLGENLAIAASLTKDGADIYENLLRGGNAFQVALDAEYYAASDAFTALVTVKYKKLYEAFSFAAKAEGFISSAEVNEVWKKEGLCVGMDPKECSIHISLTDGRGRPIDNVTVDPDSEDGKLVWQAVERLRLELEKNMLQPITATLGNAKAGDGLGYHAAANYEHAVVEKNGEFQFKSTRNVILKKTTITATAACIEISPRGVVSKMMEGACADYWNGTDSIEHILQQTERKNN